MAPFARLPSAVSLCLLAGCGAAPPAPRHAPAPKPATPAAAPAPPVTRTETTVEQAAAPDVRALPEHATFAELVGGARALDAARQTHSEAGCLLSRGAGARFEADVLLGVRPLPEPPADLAAALDKSKEPVAALTAWGAAPGKGLVLVAFTTTSPASIGKSPLAAFVTSKGVFVRGAGPTTRKQTGALAPDAAVALLLQVKVAEAQTLLVTADAATPVSELVAFLYALPARYEVGLAVALPAGTKLPPPPPPSDELLCKTGLPDLRDGDPIGELAADALQRALAPLRDAGLSCALSAGGHALQGGKLSLALRVDAAGRIADLCVRTDDIAEPLLRRCLVETARSLAMPAPSPAGFVDVLLPLQITLAPPTAQRALCD